MKKISVLGNKGAFHELAARKKLGEEIELCYHKSFSEVACSVASGAAELGVMAIENSTAGTILSNLQLISDYRLKVAGEIYLRIDFALIGHPHASRESIRKIYSHPMAFLQCSDYLAQLPSITLQESSDTANAVAEVAASGDPQIAAIAHESTARLYGLEVLESGITSFKRNYTRFLVVAPSTSKEKIPEQGKVSFSFTLLHHKGALVEVLQKMNTEGLNLTRIQSSPVQGDPGNYKFYVDVVYEQLAALDRSMVNLLAHTENLSLLGRYPAEEFTY